MVAGKGFYIMDKMRLIVIPAFISNLSERLCALMTLNCAVQPHQPQIGLGAEARVFLKFSIKLPRRKIEGISQVTNFIEVF